MKNKVHVELLVAYKDKTWDTVTITSDSEADRYYLETNGCDVLHWAQHGRCTGKGGRAKHLWEDPNVVKVTVLKGDIKF